MSNLSSLRDMALFVEVARLENFSKASKSLNIPLATLSRRINAFENDFGVRLLNRTTRKVKLTELGQQYFKRCEHVVDAAKLAQEFLRGAADLPKGNINMTMPVDLGVYIIGPHLAKFTRKFPGITLNIDLSARNSDLISDNINIAIRIGKVKENHLVTRQVGYVDMSLYASQHYLDLHGRLTHPNELSQHSCLLTKQQDKGSSWLLKSKEKEISVAVSGSVIANNLGMLKNLAEQDLGIVCLPPILIKDSVHSKRLEPVLPNWACARLPLNAVMPSQMQPSIVNILLDFIQKKLVILT